MEEDPYLTAPLNPGHREFRLIDLWSTEGSETIECGLRTFSVDEEYPPYVALSYAWGHGKETDHIKLNGVRFGVRNNLWRFLHHMRLQHGQITLWIDAICIDQSNVKERNHQVQMMRQIYSNAQSVSIWLGEAGYANDSDIAMGYLARRKPFGDENAAFNKFWSQRQAKAILSLCERDYWRRIWIVQEIMLAKEATIYCGSRRISWHHFEQLVNDLQAISDRGREKHTPCVSSVLNSPAIVIAKAKSAWDGNRQPLTALLQLYHDHEATDIRDKVYALVGLAQDDSHIVIDYDTSVKDLLVKVLYHACAFWVSSTARKSATKELIRFGKLVGEMLRVHCSEEEIEFHISIASREAYKEGYEHPTNVSHVGTLNQSTTQNPLGEWLQSSSTEDIHAQLTRFSSSGTSISTGLASRSVRVPLLEDNHGVLQRPLNHCRVPMYECVFWFLNCSYASANMEEWKEHCLSHFSLEEPPRSVRCPLCDFEFESESGRAAWDVRMDHIAYEHFFYGETLRVSRPDFGLFHHLWRNRLINDQDLKELKGGNHNLTRPPRRYFIRTISRRERNRRRS